MVYPVGTSVTLVDDEIGVQFAYWIGGYNQVFVVSRDALQDHFGLGLAGLSADEQERAALQSFNHGWERIRNVAARRRDVPSEQPLVLKSGDFSAG
jgi:hypothetical protein